MLAFYTPAGFSCVAGKPSYRLIEHGSDVEIEVIGTSLAELVENCVAATADIIVSTEGLEDNSSLEVKYRYSDHANLIVQVLTDVIGEFEVNDTLYYGAVLKEPGSGSAAITFRGHRFSSTPAADTVIKAVTYHNIVFDTNRGIARITFDL